MMCYYHALKSETKFDTNRTTHKIAVMYVLIFKHQGGDKW